MNNILIHLEHMQNKEGGEHNTHLFVGANSEGFTFMTELETADDSEITAVRISHENARKLALTILDELEKN